MMETIYNNLEGITFPGLDTSQVVFEPASE